MPARVGAAQWRVRPGRRNAAVAALSPAMHRARFHRCRLAVLVGSIEAASPLPMTRRTRSGG